MNTVEEKAIQALDRLLENKYTLQPENITSHNLGYLVYFHLSNGDQYFVKVYDDESKSIIFKALNPVS